MLVRTGGDRRHRRGGGDGGERELLEPRAARRGGAPPAGGASQAAKRVNVEHQPRKRQRDRVRLRQHRGHVQQQAGEPRPRRPVADRAPDARAGGHVRHRRQQRERRGQQVGLARRPRHRLHAQRVQRPQQRRRRRHPRRPPRVADVGVVGAGTGAAEQRDEQPVDQRGVERVQQPAAQVIHGRRQSPGGELQLQRQPRERLVDAQVERRERPSQLRPAEAAEVRVAREVDVVVPRDEIARQRGHEHERRGRDDGGDDGAIAMCCAAHRFT